VTADEKLSPRTIRCTLNVLKHRRVAFFRGAETKFGEKHVKKGRETNKKKNLLSQELRLIKCDVIWQRRKTMGESE
jgi:hypothetical protein